MMILLGLLIIVPVLLIIRKYNDIKTNKIKKSLLNTVLFIIALVFIVICFMFPTEPYIFNILDPMDYILYSAVIYVFSPFMWIITFHYCSKLLNKIRVRKNAKLKDKNRFKYYRDDLDKISPNLIMFTSIYDIDYRKSITATILKLKITGYIEEKNSKLICVNKDESLLTESEKMVLRLIRNNDFSKSDYKKTIENKVLKNKYVRKNRFGIIGTLTRILLVIGITVGMFYGSMKLDEYVFENYHIISFKDDTHNYIDLNFDDDIEKLYYKEGTKDEDYYGQMYNYSDGRRMSYNYSLIKADRLQYKTVRKAILLNVSVPLSILLCMIAVVVSLYIVIDQLIHFNKKYRRTLKGKELLNKAYALKNFLKDFSTIKNRKEEELILWEYYLIYAVVLGINVKINDEVIKKYIK